jgi:hypothetical protein
VYLCVFIVLKVHVYVLSRKDWVLSETGVTPPILPGNIPSCIFGKILYTALVCVLVWFSFQTCISQKGLCGYQFIVNFHNNPPLPNSSFSLNWQQKDLCIYQFIPAILQLPFPYDNTAKIATETKLTTIVGNPIVKNLDMGLPPIRGSLGS